MGVRYNPKIITDGLVGYWDAGNIKSYRNYNLATYSQDFTNDVYIKSTGLVSATGLLAPDGTLTATTLTDDDTTYEKFGRTFTVPNDSSTYNISIYIKKTTGGTSSRTGFNVGFSIGGTLKAYNIRFNSDTGVVSGADAGSVTSENNSYWRLSFTVTNNSTGNTNMYVDFYPATGIYDGPDLATATGSQTVWGFQVTRGATLLPYKVNTNDSADTWYDISGNGNHATTTNGPTYNLGNSGYFTLAPASSQWFSINSTNGFSYGSSPSTICGWATTTVVGGYAWIMSYGKEGTGNARFIGKSGSTYYVGGYGSDITASGIVTGNWFYIAGVYDGTNALMYINGVLVAGPTPLAWNTISSVARIGQQVNNFNEFWNGNIATVKVYNRALSAAEIQQNFNATRGRFNI